MLVVCPGMAQAVTIYAVRGSNLVSFSSTTPATLLTSAAITGLQPGETVRGIDFRPATAELYVLGSSARLYKANVATGALTQVGGVMPIPTNLASGFDFNPMVDRIRLLNTGEKNYRINPNNADVLTDTDQTPAGNIVAAAYTNSFASATSTTLYAIDSIANTLVTLASPNTGVVTTVGPLGVNPDVSIGFDIDPRDGIAYTTFEVGGVTGLYTINLGTGAATLVGAIGDGTVAIESMAVSAPGVIGFSATAMAVNENNVAAITVNRVGGTEGAVTADIVVTGGTASNGNDYLSPAQTVSFASGQTTKTVLLSPYYDFAAESPETVQISLTNATGGTSVNPTPIEVTINDVARNVSSATWFNSTPMNLPGSGTGGGPGGSPATFYPSPIEVSGFLNLPVSKVTVTLSGLNHPFVADLDVVLVAPDGRTTLLMSDVGSSSDFVNTNLTFDDAATDSLPLTNTTIPSGTYKPTQDASSETFVAPGPAGQSSSFGTTLANLTGNGANGRWSLYIVDDTSLDSGSLISGWSLTLETPPSSFSTVAGPIVVNEIDGVANVTVNRTGNLSGIARLDYATTDGSAIAGSDYSTTTGTLVFADGVASQNIAIPLLNDALNEQPEGFSLTLSNPRSDTTQAVIATAATVPITINDDDLAPNVTINSIVVAEGNSGSTNATFTVSLSTPASLPVTVNYATSNGSALAGEDFAAASGTVTFPAGSTTQNIAVAISGDLTVEANENFNVNLSGVVNANIASGVGTCTITNDDAVPAPQLLLYTPTSGLRNTFVTLVGINLAGITSVKFNGVTTTFIINSPTRITAKVPANATTGKITITTAGGTATSSGNYTVIPPPILSGFSPVRGPANTVVTLTGTNFIGVRTVKFNGTIAQFTVVSPTRVTAKVPLLATSGKIELTTLAGKSTSAANFTVTPKINALSPATGAPGTLVIIDGLSFLGTSAVRFNGKPAAFTILSATRLRATVPATATTGKVTVVTPGGTATSPGNFTVVQPPAATTPLVGSSGLSLIAANSATGVISLQFTSVLDADSATNAATYSVAVDGREIAVEGVRVNGAVVSLVLPEGSLQPGDRIVVQWRGLRDSNGRALGGTAGVTAR